MAASHAGRIPGSHLVDGGGQFSVRAPGATRIDLCLFDEDDRETGRLEMERGADALFSLSVPGVVAGQRYGFRADGPFAPQQGHRFDASKLLVDPFAIRIDRPYRYDTRLARFGEDTADLVPKAILAPPLPDAPHRAPGFRPGGLVYEIPVRAFTMLHPDISEAERGTLRALAHPAILAHLKSLHVAAVELMPIAAWIDERHLPPLGLTNAWGYNPVTMLALDPRLAPGGIADLRHVTETLHAEGIDTIVDVVFNHTGESDALGPTLSLRGLGNATFYRHDAHDPGLLVNDTGCGNTLACDRAEVQEIVLAAMRHLVLQGGVDGFRFDLAPILGRGPEGFSPQARLFELIAEDPALAGRLLVAEPWDIGPGGYQLGNFPAAWLEWNDRARDDIRTFWRGDAGKTGALATRLSGSSDIFGRDGATSTRTVNFVAAHDGFPLGDLVAYETKHNRANGEDNRDGHSENLSWNNGVEGKTDDAHVLAAREHDARALIATLFASRGAILLTAGDEFGHSQGGNNNAYAQDNAVTWRDWGALNEGRLAFTRAWAALRTELPALREPDFLIAADGSAAHHQVTWLSPDGAALAGDGWNDPALECLVMVIGAVGNRIAVAFNRGRSAIRLSLPETAGRWRPRTPVAADTIGLPPRSVGLWQEDA